MDNYAIGGMISDASAIEELFKAESTEEETTTETEKKNTAEETQLEEENKEVTEETPTVEELFRGSSEKVGNEDNKETEKKKEPTSKTETGSSPKNNPYSSIAYAMYEEGVLSNLSEDDLKDVTDGQALVALMDKNQEARYTEQQKRVLEALDAGVEKDVVRQYENTIQALDNVSVESIEDETPEGEKLRKTIIYQYYIDKGESQDRATKMVDRALSGGTDVEDAKEFLEELKTSTKERYSALIAENKRQIQEYKQQQEQAVAKAKKKILEDEHVLGNISIDKQTRQKAIDYWLKPVHKKEDGTFQSEIQKYAEEHPEEFQIQIALLFAMSDKFKNPEKIAKDTVRKAKNKAMQELEYVVNNTQRTPSGTIDINFKDDDSNFNTLKFATPDMWK